MDRPTALRVELTWDTAELQNRCNDALASGFNGIELTLSSSCVEQAPGETIAADRLLVGATRQDLPVVAVAAWCAHTDIEPALDQIASLLRFAASLRARCLDLTIPGVHGRQGPDGFACYQDALNFVHQILNRLRLDAEAAGVALALEPAVAGALLSPVEFRELIDAANSWAVGACIDVQRVAGIGLPVDWLTTLGHRVHTVRLRDASDVRVPAQGLPKDVEDMQALGEALDRIPRDRPIIAAGLGTAKELRSRLAMCGCPARSG